MKRLWTPLQQWHRLFRVTLRLLSLLLLLLLLLTLFLFLDLDLQGGRCRWRRPRSLLE